MIRNLKKRKVRRNIGKWAAKSHTFHYITDKIFHNIDNRKYGKKNLSLSNIFASKSNPGKSDSLIVTILFLIFIISVSVLVYCLEIFKNMPINGDNKHDLILFVLSSINIDVDILMFTFVAFMIILMLIIPKVTKFSRRNKLDIYDTIHFVSLMFFYIMYFYVILIPTLLVTYKLSENIEYHIQFLNRGITILLLLVFPFMYLFSLLYVFKLMNNINLRCQTIGVNNISKNTYLMVMLILDAILFMLCGVMRTIHIDVPKKSTADSQLITKTLPKHYWTVSYGNCVHNYKNRNNIYFYYNNDIFMVNRPISNSIFNTKYLNKLEYYKHLNNQSKYYFGRYIIRGKKIYVYTHCNKRVFHFTKKYKNKLYFKKYNSQHKFTNYNVILVNHKYIKY